MIRLIRKKDTGEGSFLEYAGSKVWDAVKKFFELLVKVIKRIIKEVWNNA